MPIIVSTVAPSAATVQRIVNRIFRLIEQPGSGEEPTDQEADDIMEAMNAMLGVWRNEGLMCFARQDETIDLVAAQAEYTIGPNGDLDSDRPVAIEKAWIVSGDHSYAVDILTDAEYADIGDKTATSTWPDKLNYKATMELGTVTVYPVPTEASELHLLTRVVLEGLSIADTLNLPPGWEEAIATNTAVHVAPEFSTDVRPAVVQMARDSKAAIKRINSQPIKGSTELAALFGGSRSNIITG